MILEGEVEEAVELERFLDAYEKKYELRPDAAAMGAVVFVLRPRVAQTWDERDYVRTATRWVFD